MRSIWNRSTSQSQEKCEKWSAQKNFEKLPRISKNQRGHLFELAGWQEVGGSRNSQHNQLSPLPDMDAGQAEN